MGTEGGGYKAGGRVRQMGGRENVLVILKGAGGRGVDTKRFGIFLTQASFSHAEGLAQKASTFT